MHPQVRVLRLSSLAIRHHIFSDINKYYPLREHIVSLCFPLKTKTFHVRVLSRLFVLLWLSNVFDLSSGDNFSRPLFNSHLITNVFYHSFMHVALVFFIIINPNILYTEAIHSSPSQFMKVMTFQVRVLSLWFVLL